MNKQFPPHGTPWCPDECEEGEVIHYFDGNLAGEFTYQGDTWFYQCICGHESEAQAWLYTYIPPEESEWLEPLFTFDSFTKAFTKWAARAEYIGVSWQRELMDITRFGGEMELHEEMRG